MARRSRDTSLPPPFLKRVWLPQEDVLDFSRYPLSLPIVKNGGFDLSFDKAITILIGETDQANRPSSRPSQRWQASAMLAARAA